MWKHSFQCILIDNVEYCLLVVQMHEHWPDLRPSAVGSAAVSNCVKMTFKTCAYYVFIVA